MLLHTCFTTTSTTSSSQRHTAAAPSSLLLVPALSPASWAAAATRPAALVAQPAQQHAGRSNSCNVASRRALEQAKGTPATPKRNAYRYQAAAAMLPAGGSLQRQKAHLQLPTGMHTGIRQLQLSRLSFYPTSATSSTAASRTHLQQWRHH